MASIYPGIGRLSEIVDDQHYEESTMSYCEDQRGFGASKQWTDKTQLFIYAALLLIDLS